MAKLKDIYNGDEVTLTLFEGTWEVRFVNLIEGWIEVSDEEDTIRHIVYQIHIATHTPNYDFR